LVQDVNGRVVHQSRYLWLTNNRVAVPIRVFEKLGLAVGFREKEGYAFVGEPASCIALYVWPNDHSIYDSDAAKTVYFQHPVTTEKRGRIYVVVSVMQEYFSERFTSRWNAQTHTLTLRAKRASKQ
jgi:hypothetical protein